MRGIEDGLKAVGLRLLSGDEPNRNVPRLDLDMTLVCTGAACGYAVRLQLIQRVRLSRRLGVENVATTWSDGYQNAISKSELPALMDVYSADARTLIKYFVDDYQAVNRER